MRAFLQRSAAAVCLATILGCGQGMRTTSDQDRAARAQRSALSVLQGEQLQNAIDSGATLVQILATRVSSLRLLPQGVVMENCPRFILRANASTEVVTSPDIYVNDTRSVDSCILDSVSLQDLEAIEVYSSGASPSGMAARANTGGMIVLRTRMR